MPRQRGTNSRALLGTPAFINKVGEEGRAFYSSVAESTNRRYTVRRRLQKPNGVLGQMAGAEGFMTTTEEAGWKTVLRRRRGPEKRLTYCIRADDKKHAAAGVFFVWCPRVMVGYTYCFLLHICYRPSSVLAPSPPSEELYVWGGRDRNVTLLPFVWIANLTSRRSYLSFLPRP